MAAAASWRQKQGQGVPPDLDGAHPFHQRALGLLLLAGIGVRLGPSLHLLERWHQTNLKLKQVKGEKQLKQFYPFWN